VSDELTNEQLAQLKLDACTGFMPRLAHVIAAVNEICERRAIERDRDAAIARAEAAEREASVHLAWIAALESRLDASGEELEHQAEERTAEAIAAWLESRPDITTADTMLHVARLIRAGAWRKEPK
jgi:hypothetical protein